MPSKHANAAPRASWHLAQIAVEDAEKQALRGASPVLTLEHNALYEAITVESQPPKWVYTVHYRQTDYGWPAKGRTQKNVSRHDAITEVADNLDVAAARELVASEPARQAHAQVSAEMQRLMEWVPENQPLHSERHLR